MTESEPWLPGDEVGGLWEGTGGKDYKGAGRNFSLHDEFTSVNIWQNLSNYTLYGQFILYQLYLKKLF